MLHIILLILKIIGIVLLCIVGILLLVAACVLFVPVRYRVRLTREEGMDQPPVVVYVKATWLLHLVNVLVRYPAELVVRARIFVFTIFRIPEKEKKTGKKSKEKKRKAGEGPEEEKKKSEKVSSKEKKKAKKEPAKEREDMLTDDNTEDSGSLTENQKEINEKQSLFDKIGQIIRKIKEFFKNIQYTIREFCDKIKAASDNIQYYREVVVSAPFRQSFELCKKELVWVLKKLKPDRFEADFIVGMEDPAVTGEILAVCGMLYPIIGQHIRVVGDFGCEKTRIEGQLYIRGRIRVVTLIRTFVRIYFNKDIKKLIKMFKKEDA